MKSFCARCDVSALCSESRGVLVLNGRHVGTSDFSCGFNCLLQSGPVVFGGRFKPDDDGRAENRLDYCSVEPDLQLVQQLQFPELTQAVHPLLDLRS